MTQSSEKTFHQGRSPIKEKEQRVLGTGVIHLSVVTTKNFINGLLFYDYMTHTTMEFEVPESEVYTVLEKGLGYLTDMASPRDTIRPEMSQSDVMAQMLMGLFAAEKGPGRTQETVEYLRAELESGRTEASRYLDHTVGRSEKVDVSVAKLSDDNYRVSFRAIHLRAVPEELHRELEEIVGYKGTVTE